MRATNAPATLEILRRDGASEAQVWEVFDSLPPVDVEEMMGSWRGAGLDTGHPMDGLLELYGWHGKRFEGPDAAHPLVFRDGNGLFSVDPAGLSMPLLVRAQRATSDERVARVVRRALRLRRTTRPKARLRMVEHRGASTATMIYDALPINDHFRRVDDDTLLGAMDARGLDQTFFWTMHRELS